MANILIVDDDRTIGFMLQDILEFSGHKVTVSQEPRKTKENIQNNNIDLILLDKLISGVDGTDVCKTLKEDEEVAHIPVIMMSALHNVDEICKSAGAVDFLSKPFDMDTLTAKVENILQKQEKSS
ncbi:MAG: response regulator [Gramella sp.]|nr:response regulator [Christiangramia sp.]